MNIGMGQQELAHAGIKGKAVHPFAGGEYHHGAGAVDDVARGHLPPAGLKTRKSMKKLFLWGVCILSVQSGTKRVESTTSFAAEPAGKAIRDLRNFLFRWKTT